MGVVPHGDTSITATSGCLVQAFEVDLRLTDHPTRIGKLRGDRFDIAEAHAAVQVTPWRGTAAKVVVTFGD